MKDKKDFPWRPKPFALDWFPEELLKNSDGDKVKTADVFANSDAVGIYFSAHWCPPCKAFTPNLVKNYNALKEAGKKVEIIFASSDSDETAFNDYYKEMSFCALPYSERTAKSDLSEYFECQGIPYLVFFDPKTLKTITINGRGGISSETFIEDFPYHPKSSYDLSESMDGLTKETSVIVFTDEQTSEDQKKYYGIVRETADAYKAKGDEHIKKWFTGSGKSGIEKQIRPSFGLPGPKLKKLDFELERMVPEVNNVGPYSAGWVCNACRKHGPASEANWRHLETQYDLCDECYEKIQNLNDDEPAGDPPMFV